MVCGCVVKGDAFNRMRTVSCGYAERYPMTLFGMILLYLFMTVLLTQHMSNSTVRSALIVLFWLSVLVLSLLFRKMQQFGLCRPKKISGFLLTGLVLPLANLCLFAHERIGAAEFFNQAIWMAGSVLWEEILFRNILLRYFLERDTAFSALLKESLLFSCMHMVNYGDSGVLTYVIVQCLVAMGVGFWLSIVAWKSGSIVLCVLAHLCINLSSPTSGYEPTLSGITVLQGGALVAAGVFYFVVGCLLYCDSE